MICFITNHLIPVGTSRYKRGSGVSKAVQMNLKIDSDLREKIQAAADARGFSATREINDRLQRSFGSQTHLAILDEGGPPSGITAVLAQVMFVTGHHAMAALATTSVSSKAWQDNADAYDQVCRAVNSVMEAFRPKRVSAAIDPKLAEYFDRIGETVAKRILDDLAVTDRVSKPAEMQEEQAHLIAQLQRLLGPLVERIGNREESK